MAHDRFMKWVICLSFNLILYMNGGFADFLCPGVADMDSTARLTYIFSGPANLFYNNPNGDAVAFCASSDGFTQCLSNGNNRRFNGTVVNTTHSFLEINDVQMQDAGDWTCEDQTNDLKRKCSLAIRKTPTCHITSGNDTNSLDIHENISLSVNITDYYCSTPIDFLLRAGNAEEVLIKQTTVKENNVTSDVFSSTLNVSESHIGSMELIFICNSVRKAVQCAGVQTLWKRPSPLCSITVNKEAGLNVGEEIIMSVYIGDYFCSRSLEFFLRTGGEIDRLNVTGIYHKSITFKVKESHFGPVYLEMNCNYVRRNIPCDGTQELIKGKFTTTSSLPPANGIECETRSCLLLLGVGTGVAGTLLLVGLCHLVIYLMRRKNTPCVSGNHYDEFQGRNVDTRTGYDEVGIQRSQEADTPEGGEYEMTGNHYYNLQRGNYDETHGYMAVDVPRSRDNATAKVAEGEASEP